MLVPLLPILLCATLSSSLRVAPRRGVLSAAAAALVAPAAAGASLLNTEEGELTFAERARIEGRAKADERRAGFEAWTNKVSTLGGVEGQVTNPNAGAPALAQQVAGVSPIKLKRAPDRTDADDRDISEIFGADLGFDIPKVKFQMKRAPGTDDPADDGLFKMKR